MLKKMEDRAFPVRPSKTLIYHLSVQLHTSRESSYLPIFFPRAFIRAFLNMSHQINPAYFPSTNFSLSDGINHDFWPLLDVNRLQHFQETRPSCFEDMMGALQNSKDVDRDHLSWWPQLIFPIPLYVDPRDPDAFYMWPLEALKLLQDATVGYNIGYALQIFVSMDDKTLKIILSRRPGLPIERIYWLKAFAILFDVVTNIPGVEADEEA